MHEWYTVLREELWRYEPTALHPEDVHSVQAQHKVSQSLTVTPINSEPLTAAGSNSAVHRAESEGEERGG